MNVPHEAVMFVAAILIGLIGWLTKRSISEIEKDVSENAGRCEKLEQWKDEHEKESHQVRRQLEKDIADNAAAIKVNASQYAEILRRLGEIDSKIGRIETRDQL